MFCRRPLKGSVLTQRHRQLRVIWARNMLANRRNWRHMVFSDESKFNLSNADGCQPIYRWRHEHFAANCVTRHDRFGGGGVTVWGEINHNFMSSLIILMKTLTLPLIRRHQTVNNLVTF
jgi:hypothetical protein